ncbi:DUF968 domain-containing protein [Aquirhabdus parva]|uniref:DUF968 domain-containing protein n=1 Tax=Aquirhabdus parva TaxID=2283318 RepID=A0A345P9C1_9GAMM|nr:hypothetical protein [Aquirhabdus parva]AXI03880.1 hypothetical protein HYN46_14155 [Aquirhabdus parva]
MNSRVEKVDPDFEYFRSTMHLTLIRSLPCCICGAGGVAPAHSRNPAHGHRKDALASDEFTIPLCGKVHLEYDPTGYRAASEAWFIKKVKETAELLRARHMLLAMVELLLIERGVL